MSGETLAGRVAARREQRVARLAARFVLPVPGFEDLLACRYRPLSFEEKRAIALRHDRVGEDAEQEVAAAADLLVTACVEVLAAEDGAMTPLSSGWTAALVRDMFGLGDEAPEGATVRQALIAALGSDGVMECFGAYHRRADEIVAAGEDAAVGESKPSVEG